MITATDVTILQLVWPNGARRYELVGRDGSLLCDPFSSVWYRNLQGLGPYGSLNSANEIDLDVRRFSQKYDLLEHLTYLIGDVNHGHWFFDHYAKAIVADFFKLPPLLIRPLDSVKLESLALASVKALSIPPGITDSALIRCHRLTILSNPPPRIIPHVIRSSLSVKTVESSDIIFLNKSAGNRRLNNLDLVLPSLASMGVKVLDPTQLSFRELLSAICSAKLVISPLGAESVNHLFRDRCTCVFLPTNVKYSNHPAVNWLQANYVVNQVYPIYCPVADGFLEASPDGVKFDLSDDGMSALCQLIGTVRNH